MAESNSMHQHPPITHNLKRLRSASNRLNERASRVQSILKSLENALTALHLDFRFVHPHPIDEQLLNGPSGKRIIELRFLCYARVGGDYRLGIKSLKVLESKQSMATESPGQIIPIADAPTDLRHRSIQFLPALIAGLTDEVERAATELSMQCERIEWIASDLGLAVESPVIDEHAIGPNLPHGDPLYAPHEKVPPLESRGRGTRPLHKTPPRVIINRALPRRPTPLP